MIASSQKVGASPTRPDGACASFWEGSHSELEGSSGVRRGLEGFIAASESGRSYL
jgi:hypothetical protein